MLVEFCTVRRSMDLSMVCIFAALKSNFVVVGKFFRVAFVGARSWIACPRMCNLILDQ